MAIGLQFLEAAEQRQVAGGVDWSYPITLVQSSEGYAAAGRFENAERAVACAIELASGRREQGNLAWALYVWGEIGSRASPVDLAKSERHYGEAVVLAGELGMSPLVAHGHLGLGNVYRRTGKRQESQEHLTTATTMYREMEMTYWLAQADADLPAVGS
jgi:tetratricopeptide (TPR) repeat protein